MPRLIKSFGAALKWLAGTRHIQAMPVEPTLPCNGCGFCCVKSPCKLAVSMYDLSSFYGGATLPCPALSWNGERHVCANAERHREQLAIGKGCCAPLTSWWRKEVRCRL